VATTLIALYRSDGSGIDRARLVTVSADPALCAEFARKLLATTSTERERDPVMAPVVAGRRTALRLVARGQHAPLTFAARDEAVPHVS
jgi:hypothetical protein